QLHPAGPHHGSPATVRTSAFALQRRRLAGGGIRAESRTHAGEFSASLQPRRPDQQRAEFVPPAGPRRGTRGITNRAGGSLRCRSVGQREDVALLTCVQVCMRCKAKCVSLVDRRPVRSGAADRDLVIDMKAPLRLYLAFDEWQVTEE